MNFSGKVVIAAGTVEAKTSGSLGTAAVQLGSLGTNTSSVLKFNIPGYTTNVIANQISALSSGSNTIQNSSDSTVSLVGGVEKDGSIVTLLGKLGVNSDITGTSANSDVVVGDSTTTGDVTLYGSNTYDYNGPTTVNSGSTLTFANGGVSLPNSDVTINAGATLVLNYASDLSIDSCTENSVHALALVGTLAINLNATLVAGTYTLLNYNSKGGSGSATISYSGAPNAGLFNVTGDLTSSGYTITVSEKHIPTTTYTVGGTVSGLAAGKSAVLHIIHGVYGTTEDLTVSSNGSFTFT
ncbi:MAG: hypothetical protein EBS18_04850, partial [Actinobacteria bacterium]|nr:hypothetical protein [Actinomycetota bacterium]